MLTPLNADSSDPGDETQKRLRYQAAAATIYSLGLFNEEQLYCEVFCEHHEDILLKCADSSFIGIQVKTRGNSREQIKAGDSEVLPSLAYFAKLEKEFPTQFRQYLLVSNHQFWKSKENGSNLEYLLTSIKKGDDKARTTTFIKKVLNCKSAQEAEITTDHILSALSKTKLQQLSSFGDIERKIVELIAMNFPDEFTYSTVFSLSGRLIDYHLNAASLAFESPKKVYFSLHENHTELELQDKIKGKLITKDIILNQVQEILLSQTPLLTGTNYKIPGDNNQFGLIETKMRVGEISIENRELMIDLARSTEQLSISWLHKYGEEKAKRLYEHHTTLVRTESQEAHDECYNEDSPFGSEMLNLIRGRLRHLHVNEECDKYGVKYNHLLGFTGILTELCKLWWSKRFSIPTEK